MDAVGLGDVLGFELRVLTHRLQGPGLYTLLVFLMLIILGGGLCGRSCGCSGKFLPVGNLKESSSMERPTRNSWWKIFPQLDNAP